MKPLDYEFIEFDAWKQFGKYRKAISDCTVIALAILFNIHYDKANKITRLAGRRYNRGFHLNSIRYTGREFTPNKTHYGNKLIKKYIPIKKMTLGKFPFFFPVGRFVVNLPSHAIAFVDGVAIGAWKPKPHSVIESVYSVEK